MTNTTPIASAAYAVWASIVRTLVPVIVGSVASWGISLGLPVDDELKLALTSLLTLALTGLYYIGVRLLETFVTPKLGWLLGLAKSPDSYSTAPPAS